MSCGKNPRQQKSLLGRAVSKIKDRVVGQRFKDGVEMKPGMWTCYTGDCGALALTFPELTEPDWNKGGRRKAACPKE